MVTVESLYLRREPLLFCSCSSAGGSIPSCQVLSPAPTPEPWPVPPPCTDVATTSCFRSVSHYPINNLSYVCHQKVFVVFNSGNVTSCAHLTSLGLPQCQNVMSWAEETTCCACKRFQRVRVQRRHQLEAAAAAVQLKHKMRRAMRTTGSQIVPLLTSRGKCWATIPSYQVFSHSRQFLCFLPGSFMLILCIVAGNCCLFVAYFTDISLLLESSPLQNDANKNNTDGSDAKVKCLFIFLFRLVSLSWFNCSSYTFSVFSGWADQWRETCTSYNQL